MNMKVTCPSWYQDALAQAFDQLSQAEQTLQEQAAKIAQGLGQLGTP